jgi:hypothetical protein
MNALEQCVRCMLTKSDSSQSPQLIELKITALSGAIREKPEWWVKETNLEITAKWRAEVHVDQDYPEPEEEFDYATLDDGSRLLAFD